MTEQRNILGTIGPRVNLDTLAEALASGDGTFHLSGQRYTGDGIVVAVAPIRTLSDAVAYVESHPAPFYRTHALGSWTDPADGTLYLDIVEIFPREQFNDAMDAGTARGEIAIWDNGRKELFVTGAVK